MQAALDNIYRNRAGSENLLRENTLRRWAAGSIGAEELGERASVLGWDLYCPRFCVLCMAPRKNGSLTVCRASVTALLKMQCQVEGFWDEKGRYTLILSGKTLNTEELSRQISELAAYEDFEKDAVMAFGTVVTQYELLHTSYHAAGDALETANPADGQVFVRLDDTAQGFDADLLTEELRVLFFNADIDDETAGFLHLAQKLYRNGWDATVFPKVCRACLHVMTQEFPMQKALQEQLYDLSESILQPYGAAHDTLCARWRHERRRRVHQNTGGRQWGNPRISGAYVQKGNRHLLQRLSSALPSGALGHSDAQSQPKNQGHCRNCRFHLHQLLCKMLP